MIPLLKIVIEAGENTDLACIMEAYIHYYSKKAFDVYIPGRKNDIHPLTLQVMKEDGIEIRYHVPPSIADPKPKNFDILISINNQIPPQDRQNSEYSEYSFSFSDPFRFTQYDRIVQSFRDVREEIKKASIEIVGILTMVA